MGWTKDYVWLTISAISGSSGFGSAMSSWMEVRTVEMFRDGFQAPLKEMTIHIKETLLLVCVKYILVSLIADKKRKIDCFVIEISFNLWWEFKSIVAYSSWIVNVWMVDRGQESYFGRLKRVPRGKKTHQSCLSAVRIFNWQRQTHPC